MQIRVTTILIICNLQRPSLLKKKENARGWATLLLDRLRDFVVVPYSMGGNSSFELHTQSTEERATLDRYHHFHITSMATRACAPD